MKIIVDKEAKVLITQMCDVGLKAGGLRSLNGVTDVLNSMEDYVEPKKSNEEKKSTEKIIKKPIGETNG